MSERQIVFKIWLITTVFIGKQTKSLDVLKEVFLENGGLRKNRVRKNECVLMIFSQIDAFIVPLKSTQIDSFLF
jgi:hypothetical protein